ncbi:ABC transporter permease [Phytoactinopolyspora sp. XMNu-373]|uniref:ABC transporter permease n=2 Tax=Phytoactinopolyspora mesophila TaxID=2650750 RepID=A0A7K3M8N6_9ACTN|nr:ABC transporter permease [Phytoactinopolyspora mesophila]
MAGSHVASLLASTRAELLRLRKWPAMWIMLGTGLLLNILFGYVFSYISYLTGSSSTINEDVPPAELLHDLLPVSLVETTLQGMPMFGGAILLIFGALTVGSGYGWGTWKTVFTQGPSRTATFGGTLIALASVVAAVVVVTFSTNLGISVLISAVEAESLVWPPLSETAQGVGGAMLIYSMWTTLGVVVGTLTRSPALAVGLSLVWALAVENLLRGVANALTVLEPLTNVLPGTAAGSIAGAMRIPDLGDGADDGGAPGVLTILDAGPAALLLAGYIVVFGIVATLVTTRRDVV